jgi:hypothetical protein
MKIEGKGGRWKIRLLFNQEILLLALIRLTLLLYPRSKPPLRGLFLDQKQT